MSCLLDPCFSLLQVRDDALDWNGDHLFTNFHELFDLLRAYGYFIDILGTDFTCFNASNYGALLIVDPEEV
jgi:membrane-bound transcription factor site-1 protease